METLLPRAALENDLGRVVEKVVGGTENDPWRTLHVATLKGNVSMVRLLLENGASETGYGIQAVHLAARIGSMEVLEALFAAGADLNCTDLDGRQPLHYISDSQDLPDVTQYLLERGTIIHGIYYADELTPLHIACKNDFSRYLGALLSFGALVGWFPASLLESALGTAIRCGSSSSVQTLLRHGVSPVRCGSNGRTDLHTLMLSPARSNLPTNSRFLRLLLDHVSLLAIDQNGDRVIDTIAQLVPGDLMELFLKNIPRRKVVEKKVLELKLVMGS